ncbi:MAG: M55 family metallopeptidase [Gemmatimonadales bacterium]
MKIYISVDLEGIAGIVHESQTNPNDLGNRHEYARARALMTAEANAAVAGAFEGGAKRVLVNDAHWDNRNILAESLDPRAELLSGGPKPWSMMDGIELGWDAAFLIGYHGKAGTGRSVIDHTYTDRIRDVRLNGKSVGEVGLNAALAGAFDVPVALLSGDDTLAAEVKALFGPTVVSVVVKEAMSRYAARSVSPEEACRRIREAAAAVLKKLPKPFTISAPVSLEIDFTFGVQADLAALIPGAEQPGPCTVRWSGPGMREAFSVFRAMFLLSGTAT